MENTALVITRPELSLIPSGKKSASFLRRAGAYCLDLVAIGVLDYAINIAFLYAYCLVTHQNANEFYTTNHAAFQFFSRVSGFVIYTAYFTLSYWYSNGRSFGKVCCKIRVAAKGGPLSFWRAFFRALAYQLSYLSFSVGFALPLVRKDAKSLHDLVSGTEVIEI